MKLYYAEEHTKCCNYTDFNCKFSEKEAPVFSHHFKKGEIIKDFLIESRIILIIEGLCTFTRGHSENFALEKGDMILLSVGSQFIVEAKTDLHLLIYKVEYNAALCEMFLIKDLYEEKNNVKYKAAPLKMNERMWDYAANTANCLTDGLRCSKYIRLKAIELMFIFRAYYSKEELAAFFHPILNKDNKFIEIILKHWPEVKTKAELAALANLSPSRFGAKFKQIFGVSPHQWLLSRRSEKIYYELRYTNTPIKYISDKFQFSSVQHFNDFCKKQLGATPGQIRQSAN